MRRFKVFASKEVDHPDIEIVVNFKDAPIYLAAGGLINHPKSVKHKYMYTDKQLARYNDFVESALSFITCHRVEIIDKYQSKKSYAYYVRFYPLDEAGKRYREVTIVFRIGDHDPSVTNASSRTIIRNFEINGKTLEHYTDILDEIDYTCGELCKGNFDVLNE